MFSTLMAMPALQTKKIIAEAFEKSRKDQLSKAAGGPGKSSFGGAGAGLDDDLDL